MSVIAAKDDAFTLTYELADLPTAQHKAGLAGLLVMIDSLRERKIEPLPVIEWLSSMGASITFTLESLQTVFDDLYDGSWEETPSRTKWKDKEIKRIEEVEVNVNGKVKKEKRFIYDAVRPKGAFLQVYYPPDGNGMWVKLWRDMLWNTLRGIPKTRLAYEERAEGKRSSLAKAVWDGLGKSLAQQKKGGILLESLSSSLFVGAEDANAERVPFRGPVADNLLLHFWSIVSLIHVPRAWGLERTKEQGYKVTRKEAGFVLSIPEPANLEQFCKDAREVLRELDPEGGGIRPRAALIDVHEEGGLEYLYRLAHNKALKSKDFISSLCALDVFHLQKQGNRIRQLVAERILPKEDVVRDYELLRKEALNPIFKATVLRNLLAGSLWHTHFDQPLCQHPMPIFISCQGRSPRSREMVFFGSDVRRKFKKIGIQLKSDAKGGIMDEQTSDNQLAKRVYHLIQTYVNMRTDEKSTRKYKDFSSQKNDRGHIQYPQEYREARQKICSDAFLAMRGRRDQDFIEYFTGVICSVPQYLNPEDYVAVAGALMSDWEKIKILSMLALSAHSYLPGNTQNQEVE
jgi:CRISPR-associated protein Cmx8